MYLIQFATFLYLIIETQPLIMTIYVDDEFIPVASNSTDLAGDLEFILISGYSKQPESFPCTLVEQNARYSQLLVNFGLDFKNEHKNGVYYYTIAAGTVEFESGYAKIITDPGGSINTVAYNSGVATENREATVYYRPNY